MTEPPDRQGKAESNVETDDLRHDAKIFQQHARVMNGPYKAVRDPALLAITDQDLPTLDGAGAQSKACKNEYDALRALLGTTPSVDQITKENHPGVFGRIGNALSPHLSQALNEIAAGYDQNDEDIRHSLDRLRKKLATG